MTAGPQTTVWLAPSATSYSCLCEPCLESARRSGALFADALAGASVRGTVGVDTELALARCAAGHEMVLRRVERPPGLQRHDNRQLQIA
ncbi:MAG: hypothetical protein M3P41_04480 [Actinomycetota bacterium]|nr:hypothetical protein [Actinomycetota bacterium]